MEKLEDGKQYVMRDGSVVTVNLSFHEHCLGAKDTVFTVRGYPWIYSEKLPSFVHVDSEHPNDILKAYVRTDIEEAIYRNSSPDGVSKGASSILNEAAKIVDGARQQTHGKKERSFQMASDLWSAYLGTKVSAHDVAECMSLLKKARGKCGEPIRDHYVDDSGYTAIAGELAGF